MLLSKETKREDVPLTQTKGKTTMKQEFQLFSISPFFQDQAIGKVYSNRSSSSKDKEVISHPILPSPLFVSAKAAGTELASGTYHFNFKKHSFSNIDDYLTAYLQERAVTLGSPKINRGERLATNFEDAVNSIQILDIDWVSPELLTVQEIAEQVLAKLNNKDADFCALPSSSYGCLTDKGYKNAIRLFVFVETDLQTLSAKLPSAAEQKVLFGEVLIDTKIYQPERFIFTVPSVSHTLHSFTQEFREFFCGQIVKRIVGNSFDLEVVPRVLSLSRGTSKKATVSAVDADVTGLLERLLEARFPSSSDIFHEATAERHIEMLKAASFVKTLANNLGLDAEAAWFAWGERTSRSVLDLKHLFRSANIGEWGYNQEVLEWISRNLPTANKFSYLNISQSAPVMALWCSMGTGKSVYSAKWITEHHTPNTKTVVIVPRRTLTRSNFTSLKQKIGDSLVVKHYEDKKLEDADVIVTTIHSFDKLNTFQIESVVIDEVIQVRKDLVSAPMLKSQEISFEYGSGRSNAEIWNEILSTKNILVCDAYLGETNFLAEFSEVRPDFKLVKHITPFGRNVISCLDKNSFYQQVFDRAEGGERFTMAFTSKKELFTLAETLKSLGKTVLTITGDSVGTEEDKDAVDNPNISWVKYDAVLYTTAVASGVSFDVENHFDFVAGNFEDPISITFNDQLQMIGRVRQPKTKDVLVFALNQKQDLNFDLRDQVNKLFVERQLLDQRQILPRELVANKFQEAINSLSSAKLSLVDLKSIIGEIEQDLVTLEQDPHFDFYSKILIEELSGKNLWKSHWNALGTFFGELDRFEELEEIRKQAAAKLKVGKKVTQEQAEVILKNSKTVNISPEVAAQAMFDSDRAFQMLCKEGNGTSEGKLACRAIWVRANLPFISEENLDSFVIDKGFKKALRLHDTLKAQKNQIKLKTRLGKEIKRKDSTFLMSDDCRQTASLLLWEALKSYLADFNASKAWKSLQKLANKYTGIFKILGHEDLDITKDAGKDVGRVINSMVESFGVELQIQKTKTSNKVIGVVQDGNPLLSL